MIEQLWLLWDWLIRGAGPGLPDGTLLAFPWLTVALFVATLIIGALLRPRLDTDQSPGEFQPPNAKEGEPVPVVFGRGLVTPTIGWWGDLHIQKVTKTVSSFFGLISDEVPIGHEYLVGMQLVICHGQVDELTDIWVGEKLLSRPLEIQFAIGSFLNIDISEEAMTPAPPLVGAAEPTQVNITAPWLFGGAEAGGGIVGNVDIHWGSHTQGPNDYLALFWGVEQTPQYRDICYAVLRRVNVGKSPTPQPWRFQVKRIPKVVSAAHAEIGDGDANGAEIIYEMLTAWWGLGIEPSRIDLAAFQSVAQRLHAEELGISLVLRTQQQFEAAFRTVLEHVNGVVFTDVRTGLISIDLIREDYVVGNLPVVSPTNAGDLDYTAGSWDETVNETRIRFTDVADHFQRRVAQAQNLAAIQARGQVVTETHDLPGLSNFEDALATAELFNRGSALPMARASFHVDRSLGLLRQGQPFVLNWPPLGITELVMRIISLNLGTLQEGRIHVQAVQDIWDLSGIAGADPTVDMALVPCGPLNLLLPGYDPADDPNGQYGPGQQILLEVPYWHVGAKRRVWAAVSRRTNLEAGWIPYRSEQGLPYEDLDTTEEFCPVGLLEAALLVSDPATGATVQVRNVGDLDDLVSTDAAGLLAGSRLAVVDSEIIAWETVTNLGGGVYEIGGVMRGQLDTVPRDHGLGARVFFYWTGSNEAVDISSADYPAAHSVALKPLRIDAGGLDDPNLVDAVSVITTDRALAPYPPGDVQLGGSGIDAWPAEVVGDAVLAWAHRSRTEQTEMVAQDDPTDFTLEGTITVEAFIEGFLAREWTDVTSGTVTYTLADRQSDDEDLTKAVHFRITPVGPGGEEGIARDTPQFLMSSP